MVSKTCTDGELLTRKVAALDRKVYHASAPIPLGDSLSCFDDKQMLTDEIVLSLATLIIFYLRSAVGNSSLHFFFGSIKLNYLSS
jgi:hypothetical protein